ncbi:MAG TPA: UDP-N-acetylmuramoyl-tripeptide--D-alanyl-D-alanine ligase [Candidatus Paceibacterota bacterium]|nr:UDP-N-acetylmuramoyl-tripeptide--D-alanyl-D-alanine ligase [Candidatus Paceibacterota bacterium]
MKRKFIQHTLKYLTKLILWRYKPLIIGVTGSVGKTSTKEAIYTVLKNKFKVERNVFNLNTEIGMPLTIIRGKDAKRNIFLWFYNFFHTLWLFVFKTKKYPQILVLEMSEDAPGMIKYLVDLARPKIGVITTIGDPPVHLEYYKNTNQLIEEISYLPQNLTLNDTMILNADNALVLDFKDKTVAKVLSYGFSEYSDIKVTDYKLINVDNLKNIGMNFRLEASGSFVPVRIEGVFGKAQAYALAAAAAVGLSLDMNLVEISEAMLDYKIVEGRTRFIPGIKNTWILDDSYNACPDSVRATLDILKEISANRKIVVLGDMKELGVNSKEAHIEIGRNIADVAKVFIAVGEEMVFAKEIIDSEYSDIETFWFEDGKQAKKFVKEMIKKGDLVLVKGSHSMKMEEITEYIKI